jgi:hypothetical protein
VEGRPLAAVVNVSKAKVMLGKYSANDSVGDGIEVEGPASAEWALGSELDFMMLIAIFA